MANGKNSRTICEDFEVGLSTVSVKYQKGSSNLRSEMPRIVEPNIAACDGSIVHIVDKVLLPPDFFLDNIVDIVDDVGVDDIPEDEQTLEPTLPQRSSTPTTAPPLPTEAPTSLLTDVSIAIAELEPISNSNTTVDGRVEGDEEECESI
ncbi:MAG: hypothetical protein SGARI_004797, partial [Bacillariaceae sp.]